MTPHLVVDLAAPVAVSTRPGAGRSARYVRSSTAVAPSTSRAPPRDSASSPRRRSRSRPRSPGTPSTSRATTAWSRTVGRLWNEEYGGYALFGWDNFFLAWLAAPFSRDLAYANVIEHLRSAVPEGFIPNDDRGNGARSYDRSQPPVGALMVREVFRAHPERWLLEAAFDPLLAWNRWWVKRRLNDGLLSYGSHRAENPFAEPDVGTRKTAGYESGMDDSPMYEGVPFDAERGMLELQDVGLSSLYVADCRALAEVAALLGREAERAELAARGDAMAAQLERLWDDDGGIYRNRRSDTGELSPRVSPTSFYPLLARAATPAQAARMVRGHLLADAAFGGEPMLPVGAALRPGVRAPALLEGRGVAAAQRARLPRPAQLPPRRRPRAAGALVAARCSSASGGAWGTSARTTRRSPAPATTRGCPATRSTPGARCSA